MQPQQPYTNPYDFIVNPQKPTRKPLLNLGGTSSKARIALIAGVVLVVILVLGMIAEIFSSKNPNLVNLTSVAQDQSEIIRVATEATQTQSTYINQSTTLYFAQNCLLSVSSEQQKLLAYLTANHNKLSTKVLALKQDSKTDQILQSAAASSTYDSAFLNAMQGDLNIYVTDIKTAYTASKVPQEKSLLQTDYKDTQLLQEQLTSAINNINAGT